MIKHVSEKKERDKAVIESLVWKHSPISRAEIQQMTHLRWSVITSIVRELLNEGKFLEVGRSSNPMGRKQTLLQLNEQHGFIAVVKFDAETVFAAVTDLFPRIISRYREPTYVDGGTEGLILQLISCVRKVIQQSGIAPSKLLKISVADTGVVDIEEGITISSSTLSFWNDVPLRKRFDEEFDVPLILETNTRVATLAERVLGAGQNAEDMIYVEYGKGIGAGIMLKGNMLYGHNWSAGEFGHIPIVENGPACTCGSFGCLEAVAGLSALEARCRRAIQEGSNSQALELANGDPSQITGWTVLSAANLGDKTCSAIVEELEKHLGLGISTLVNLFNPSVVILDQRLQLAGDSLLEHIARGVKKQALAYSTAHLEFRFATLGDDAGLLGAALNVLNRIFEIPSLKPPRFMIERSLIDSLAAQRQEWAENLESGKKPRARIENGSAQGALN
jgi:N-acetylglucosamine repressor